MQNAVYKGKTIKKYYSKAGVLKIYTDLQYKYAEMLENDPEVKSFETNIKVLENEYTTDFLITYMDGRQMAVDCISDQKAILRPRYVAILNKIKSYWLVEKKMEWCICIEK